MIIEIIFGIIIVIALWICSLFLAYYYGKLSEIDIMIIELKRQLFEIENKTK